MDTAETYLFGVALQAGDTITVRVQGVGGEKKLSFDETSGTAAGSEAKS